MYIEREDIRFARRTEENERRRKKSGEDVNLQQTTESVKRLSCSSSESMAESTSTPPSSRTAEYFQGRSSKNSEHLKE